MIKCYGQNLSVTCYRLKKISVKCYRDPPITTLLRCRFKVKGSHMSSSYSLVPPKETHRFTVPIIFVDFDVTTPFLRGGPWGEWTGTPFSERDNFIRYGLITGFRVWVGTHIQGYSIHFNWKVCGLRMLALSDWRR